MTNRLAIRIVLGALVASACAPTPLDPRSVRSCRGEYVDACRPYTYARVVDATLSPAALAIADPSARAHVTVRFETCGPRTPAQPRIDLSALLGRLDDAGVLSPGDGGTSSARVIPLATIPPSTDPTATTLDVMIDNPFFADVPPDTAIILQFTPVIDGCSGEVFPLTYRTGPRAMP